MKRKEEINKEQKRKRKKCVIYQNSLKNKEIWSDKLIDSKTIKRKIIGSRRQEKKEKTNKKNGTKMNETADMIKHFSIFLLTRRRKINRVRKKRRESRRKENTNIEMNQTCVDELLIQFTMKRKNSEGEEGERMRRDKR